MYKVVENFVDLQDGNRAYKTGDTYPREGFIPRDARIEELAGKGNALGRPIIKKVEERANVRKR